MAGSDRVGVWAPVICALIAFALHLAPKAIVLTGWDEAILAEITGRIAHVSLPNRSWYDVIVPTGYGYPPVFFWQSAFFVRILGPEIWVYRLTTAIGAALCAGSIAIIARSIAGNWAAWITGFIAAAAPGLAYYDTISMDPLMTGFILSSVACSVASLQSDKSSYFIAALALSAIACTVKYHAVVYHAALCAFVFVLVLRGSRIDLNLAALVALAPPACLLIIEALTAQLYGWEKTHIAEALRMTEWGATANDPMTGYPTAPSIAYYPILLFLRLGVVQVIAAAGGLCWMLYRGGPAARWVVVVLVVWCVWAQWLDMKHARYILPAAFLLMGAAGIGIARIGAASLGKHPAIAISIVVVLGMSWQAYNRLTIHAGKVDRHVAILDAVADRVPESEPVIADARPFQGTVTTRLRTMPRPVVTPYTEAYRDANWLLTDEAAYTMARKGALAGLQGYAKWRDEAMTEWDVVYDSGVGEQRVRLLHRPGELPE